MSGKRRDHRVAAVEIPERIMRQIFGQARAAFPNECCGWLSGAIDTGHVDAIRACENVQDSAAAVVEGRTAETAFTIQGKDLFEFNRALDGSRPPRVIYHSHPNGKAYFSATDQAAALSPFGDGPAYDVQHLVVGIDAERVTEAALFAWSDDAGGYTEVARFPGSGEEDGEPAR